MAPSKTTTLSRNVASKTITSRKIAPNPIAARKVAPKKVEKQLKAIFKGLTISFAGAFPSVSGGFLSHEQMGKWITLHGGTYEREVTSETTHLICTIDEYKKKGPQVLKAWKHSSRENQCYILVFEWLEDSLTSKVKRKRAERGYTLDRTLARIKKGKKDHVTFRNRFEEGVRASKELCESKLHRVYFDLDGFEYKIMLTHLDLSYNGKAKIEKYTLYLFESIAAPHTYMCGAKLSRSHRPISIYREVCHPKIFKEAMHDFKLFFKDKTKIAWEDRLEGIRISDPKAFVYTPPAVGRPVGILPFAYVRPEERPHIMSDSDTSTGSGTGTDTTSATTTNESVEYDTDSDVDSDDEEEPNSLSTAKSQRTPSLSLQSPRIYIPSDVVSTSFDSQTSSQSQNTPSSTLSFATGYSNMTQNYQSNSQGGSFDEHNDYQHNSQEQQLHITQSNSNGLLDAPYGLGIYQDNSPLNDEYGLVNGYSGSFGQSSVISFDGSLVVNQQTPLNTPSASSRDSQAPIVSSDSSGIQSDFQLPIVSDTFGTQSNGHEDISQREYIIIDSD